MTGTRNVFTPSRQPEGGDLDPASLSAIRKKHARLMSKCRQWLACSCATLTMVIVGAVYGWATTSLLHLTSGTGNVPLTLTNDESSWIVSLTVLGTMIGSLVGAQLADRRGRKYCLLLCCAIFTLGWLIIYGATSAANLYVARVILGIGAGIAYTINPMYVSEVADKKIRGGLGTLISVNVFTGSVLTCILGIWLTYKTLLVVLIIISILSFLLIMCFPDTPYFLASKGRKDQASKSITYYKGIVDPQEIKIALRTLRPQNRCRLQLQATSNIPLQTRHNIPPQRRSAFTPQRRSVIFQQRRSVILQQSEGHIPSTLSDIHSDSIWEVVETEPKLDLTVPSNNNSPSISALHSEAICEVHPGPTGELLLQSPRALQSQSTSEIHRPSTSEVHRPSTSEVHRPPTIEVHPPSRSDLHPPSTSEIHRQSSSELHRQSSSELHRPSTSEVHRPSTSEIRRPSRSELHRPSTSEVHRQSTSEVHRQSSSELHRQSSSELHRQSSSELHRQSTSEVHRPSTGEIHRQSASDVRQPSSSEVSRPSASEVRRPSTSEVHRQSTSELHRQSSSELHRPSTGEVHRQSTSELHRQSSSEVHRASTGEVHRQSSSELHRPSTSEIQPEPTSEIHPEPTSEIYPQSTREICPQSTSELYTQPTSDIHQQPTHKIHTRTKSDVPTPSKVNFPSQPRSGLRRQSIADSRTSISSTEVYIEVAKETWIAKLRAILQGTNRKALFIMLGLIMAQQFSGNFITMQYLEVLFSKSAIAIQPRIATITVLSVGLMSGSISTTTVDILGRRILLILSTLGSCITLIILAIYLLLVQYKFDVAIVSSLPIIDLVIYEIVNQIGLGTIPNVLLCEIFPTELKGFAGAITVIFDGIISFTVSKLYQVIADNIGSYLIYFIFATSCCLAFLMVLKWIPETKGKTYEEIEALLAGKNLNTSNEEVVMDERAVHTL